MTSKIHDLGIWSWIGIRKHFELVGGAHRIVVLFGSASQPVPVSIHPRWLALHAGCFDKSVGFPCTILAGACERISCSHIYI